MLTKSIVQAAYASIKAALPGAVVDVSVNGRTYSVIRTTLNSERRSELYGYASDYSMSLVFDYDTIYFDPSEVETVRLTEGDFRVAGFEPDEFRAKIRLDIGGRKET